MDQPTIRIRQIEHADNPIVASVIREVMTEFGCDGEGYSIHDEEVDSMFESYDNDRSVFYVVEKDGVVHGCGGIAPLVGAEDESICELRKMYFRNQIRGLGLGRRLLRQCLADSKRLGFQICYIESVDRMHGALALYEKFGFRRIAGPLGQTGHTTCNVQLVLDLDDFVN